MGSMASVHVECLMKYHFHPEATGKARNIRHCPTCGTRYTGECAVRLLEREAQRLEEGCEDGFFQRNSQRLQLVKWMALESCSPERCYELCEAVLASLTTKRQAGRSQPTPSAEEERLLDSLEVGTRAQMASSLALAERVEEASHCRNKAMEVLCRSLGHTPTTEELPDELLVASMDVSELEADLDTALHFVKALVARERSRQAAEAGRGEAPKAGAECLASYLHNLSDLLLQAAAEGAAGSDPSTSYAEALETFAESLALDIIAWGKNHPELTITHLKMASLANHLEKLEEATFHAQRVEAINEGRVGEEAVRSVVTAVSIRGVVSRKQGKLEEALSCYQRAERLLLRLEAPDRLLEAGVLGNLGRLHLHLADLAERSAAAGATEVHARYLRSVRYLKEAVEQLTSLHGARHPETQAFLRQLGRAELQLDSASRAAAERTLPSRPLGTAVAA